MCNLYSITTNQAAIIALFRVMNRYVGNMPPMPGVFPNYLGAGFSRRECDAQQTPHRCQALDSDYQRGVLERTGSNMTAV
jgi:hypothetical protein